MLMQWFNSRVYVSDSNGQLLPAPMDMLCTSDGITIRIIYPVTGDTVVWASSMVDAARDMANYMGADLVSYSNHRIRQTAVFQAEIAKKG